MMNRKIEILDTTLRDGSYTIGYQFSVLDNMIISSGLERAGVKLIEIGHGTGLGTLRKDGNAQAHSDIEYMRSVSDTLEASDFGFFFIPGIGNSEDIRILKEHGGGFIRIGTSIETFEQTKKYIKLVKNLGLKFWINLMKSYVYSHDEFAELCKIARSEGAEGVYLVDSAGGMLPDQVGSYIEHAAEKIALSYESNFKLGFHGHENLSLGSACALAAVKKGAGIVDGSLLGIGRSIGNSSIETLAMILKKSDFDIDIDPWSLSDLADKTIKPYLENRWRNSSIEQAMGYKEIHSSFLQDIINYCKKNDVEVRDLILSLSDESKVNISRDQLDIASKKIVRKINPNLKKLNLEDSAIKDLYFSDMTFNQYLKDLISTAEKTNRTPVLVLTGDWAFSNEKDFKLQRIRTVGNNEVGTAEIKTLKLVDNDTENLFAKIKYLMLDIELIQKNKYFKKLYNSKQSQILLYPDKNSILIHIARYLSVLLKGNLKDFKIKAITNNVNEEQLLSSLLDGYSLEYEYESENANVHILMPDDKPTYKVTKFRKLKHIIDLRSDILKKKDVDYCISQGILLNAIDCESAVISEVLSNISIMQGIENSQGSIQIEGKTIISKGHWGNNGDIIVDSVKDPKIVLGISDGTGGLKSRPSKRELRNLKSFLDYLYNKKIG